VYGLSVIAHGERSNRRRQRLDETRARSIDRAAAQQRRLPEKHADQPIAVADDQAAIANEIRQNADHLLDDLMRHWRAESAGDMREIVDPKREVKVSRFRSRPERRERMDGCARAHPPSIQATCHTRPHRPGELTARV